MSTFRAFRHRDFSLYFSGQLVSMVGTWVQNVAMGWWVFRLTGQESMLGIVMFAATLPSVFLLPLGGIAADRMDARRLVLLAQAAYLVQALAVAGLAFHPHPSMTLILLLAVALGTITAFDLPGRQVLVVQVVDKEDLPNAIALQGALFHGSRILGPALAGLLIAKGGESWCFLLNAISYFASLGTLMAMRIPPSSAPKEKRGHLEHLLEGFRFAWSHKAIRYLIGLLGLIVGLGMPFTAMMPAIVKGLGVGAREFGLLMACSGTGATLGAMALASRKHTTGLSKGLMAFSILFALLLAAFAHAHTFGRALVLLPLVSFMLVAVNTGTNTLVQLLSPDSLRGRIMALYGMVFMAAMPLGALGTGFLAQHIGMTWALTLGAMGCLAGGLAFSAFYPSPKA